MKRTTFILLLASAVFAQGVEVERGSLRVAVDIEGKFAPADPARLELDTRQYKGPFVVESITGHGSPVNEGDIVVRFDREEYEVQLRQRALGMERREMDHRHYLVEARLQREKTERGLVRAEREANRAAKKLQGFREFEVAFRDEQERQSKQAREYGMENQKDELDQLRKMYAEDELVDATEEIVLKRAERRYAQALAREELGDRNRAYQKEWYEPWTEENYVADAEAKADALAAAREKAEMEAEAAKLELARRTFELEKAREEFAEFKADGEKLNLRAPYRGLLMHEGGPWEKGAEFRHGTRVAHVMKPGAMVLEGAVAEKDIRRVQPGLAVSVAPTAYPDMTLLGRLKLDFLPSAKGQFAARIEFDEIPTGLRPGMSAKAQIVLEEVRDVVLVPKGAVKDGKVRVLGEGADPEWREVTTGPTDGKRIVIRSGLQAGERVDPEPK